MWKGANKVMCGPASGFWMNNQIDFSAFPEVSNAEKRRRTMTSSIKDIEFEAL